MDGLHWENAHQPVDEVARVWNIGVESHSCNPLAHTTRVNHTATGREGVDDMADVGGMTLDELFGTVEQEWQDQALCAQTDPEAFFPEKGGSTREAKRICKACAVRDECLEYALEHDERFGIWGGLSDRERRRLKKQIG